MTENYDYLKNALFEKTHCDIQHNGWPCGTCFFALSKKFNNKDWQSLLLFRGDYNREDLDNLPKNPLRNINKIIRILKEGTPCQNHQHVIK